MTYEVKWNKKAKKSLDKLHPLKIKKDLSLKLYAQGMGLSKEEIKNLLSVSLKTVQNAQNSLPNSIYSEKDICRGR